MLSDIPYQNLFKSRYQLAGRRDWIRVLDPEDLIVFIRIGLAAADYGRLGGRARAATAKRDNRGRFTKSN